MGIDEGAPKRFWARHKTQVRLETDTLALPLGKESLTALGKRGVK